MKKYLHTCYAETTIAELFDLARRTPWIDGYFYPIGEEVIDDGFELMSMDFSKFIISLDTDFNKFFFVFTPIYEPGEDVTCCEEFESDTPRDTKYERCMECMFKFIKDVYGKEVDKDFRIVINPYEFNLDSGSFDLMMYNAMNNEDSEEE